MSARVTLGGNRTPPGLPSARPRRHYLSNGQCPAVRARRRRADDTSGLGARRSSRRPRRPARGRVAGRARRVARHRPRARVVAPWDAALEPSPELDDWLRTARERGSTRSCRSGAAATRTAVADLPAALPSPRCARPSRPFAARWPWVTAFGTWNESNHPSQPTADDPAGPPASTRRSSRPARSAGSSPWRCSTPEHAVVAASVPRPRCQQRSGAMGAAQLQRRDARAARR